MSGGWDARRSEQSTGHQHCGGKSAMNTPIGKRASRGFDNNAGASEDNHLMDRRPSLCCVRQLDLRPANALVIERLGEGADLGVGETLGRSVRHIRDWRIIVEEEHRKPSAWVYATER